LHESSSLWDLHCHLCLSCSADNTLCSMTTYFMRSRGSWDGNSEGLSVDSLIIPSTKLASGILKVFVKTGPGQDQCKESHRIEVDLIESGTSLFPSQCPSHTYLNITIRSPRQPKRSRTAPKTRNHRYQCRSSKDDQDLGHLVPAPEQDGCFQAA
jgi:hypothetical protein